MSRSGEQFLHVAITTVRSAGARLKLRTVFRCFSSMHFLPFRKGPYWVRYPESGRTSEDHEHTIPRTGNVTREYVRWLDRARVTTVFRWWRVCPVSTQATYGTFGGQTSGLGFPAAPPPSRRYGSAKPPSRALSSDTPKRVCLRDSGVPETQQCAHQRKRRRAGAHVPVIFGTSVWEARQ
jgi:hypothetical protein